MAGILPPAEDASIGRHRLVANVVHVEQSERKPIGQRPPWKWFREESFWRSVTEQGLAGSVVALSIFLTGIAAGVIPGSFFWLLLLGVGGGAALLFGSIAIGRRMGPRLPTLSRGRRILEETALAIAILALTSAWYFGVLGALASWIAESNS